MPSARALEVFRSTMLTGSATGAADALGVSQPGISRLLKGLEQDIGYKLFKRVSGRLLPTPEALALFKEVERHFSSIAHVYAVAREIRDQRTRRLDVACLPTVGLRFLPTIFSRLTEQHGGALFSLRIESSHGVADLLRSGKSELGFISESTPKLELETIQNYSTPCFVILPDNHALIAKPVLSFSDFVDVPFIKMDDTTITGRRVAQAFARAGIIPRAVIETHLTSAVSAAVESGIGLSVVDSFTAFEHAQRGGHVRPLAEPVYFGFSVVRSLNGSTSRLQFATLAAFDARMAALKAWADGMPP
jgi:DNA-binding transcriptional LysR family regulator